jgi:myo-inositol-1(or 4)-monophosphatase
MGDPRAEIPVTLLRELEHTAVELARVAGAEILNALSRPFAVNYKGVADSDESLRNPVSEVDRATEVLVRARLAERFPQHDIIGEELDERPGRGADFVWAIDPIDGTANFINGFPLFAASIGLLYRGYPLAGAIWCSTSHTLQSGVYHAHCGPHDGAPGTSRLSFEGRPIEPRIDRNLRRHLAGEPCAERNAPPAVADLPWDPRHTGSAAIECAFTAAGLLRLARLSRPKLWDCAGGVALLQAAGGKVLVRNEGRWQAFECFEAPLQRAGAQGGALADLRYWCSSLLLGDAEAVATYAAALTE